MARRRNAPLKGARSIGSNMTEVEHGDLTILYSYQTPVAFLAPQGGYVTEKRWSVTTSKHIAKFFDLHGYDRKGAFKLPQEDLESIVTAGALRDFPINVDPTPAEQVEAVRRLTRRGMKNPPHRLKGVHQRPSPDDAYPSLGKFEGETMLAVEMYDAAMESSADEEGGDSSGPGYFWLFTDFIASDGTPRHGILEENNSGFVTLTEYDTATDAAEAWEEEVEPMLAEYFEGEED
jgi:hypothetical protein